jgi:CubicO group peptidase (beta-lactamase class C family)
VGALDLVESWPVEHVAAAVLAGGAVVDTVGDLDRSFRLASIAKPITAWACLVAVEEGTVALDTPIGQAGCTMEHLLSHAGGYGFDGPDPVSRPERTRVYSNTGIELAAEAVAEASGLPFERYLDEAVLVPLGMSATELRGSPAHALWSTASDLVAFLGEVRCPTVITNGTRDDAIRPHFPMLGGIVPGVGRFERSPWGLGFEIRGDKSPHWTGATNSPATFGHFGGAGTMTWTDPAVDVAVVALTDRPFDEWAPTALRRWPELSDAVIAAHAVVPSTWPNAEATEQS